MMKSKKKLSLQKEKIRELTDKLGEVNGGLINAGPKVCTGKLTGCANSGDGGSFDAGCVSGLATC